VNWIDIGDFQVSVVAVFTKYDQFKYNIHMKLTEEDHDPETQLNTKVESVFNEHYLGSLSGHPTFVCLESEDFVDQFTPILISVLVGMHRSDQWCTDLIEVTADALNGGIVALLLIAIQRNDLELNVKQAIKW